MNKEMRAELERINLTRAILNDATEELINHGYQVTVKDELYDPMSNEKIPADALQAMNEARYKLFQSGDMKVSDKMLYHRIRVMYGANMVTYAHSAITIKHDAPEEEKNLLVTKAMANNTKNLLSVMIQGAVSRTIDEYRKETQQQGYGK